VVAHQKADTVRACGPGTLFFSAAAEGVLLGVPVGCPIRALLREVLGLTDEYIEARLQTVFLDGKPVDDIDGPLSGTGATLALAPAMPGLMGAMLRRGGSMLLCAAKSRTGTMRHRGGSGRAASP